MKQYKLINNLVGWLVFMIAAIVYILTIESTVSFWDCGEFIATAYKLEVGHPPGAPFFMILARFASLFASDPSNVAVAVNILSALASAFTILFLFWTITHLAKKIIVKNDEIDLGKTIAIMGSGFVGALAYTFSDTFWFSAVEGEVYATSSLFTALVFWAILKWENTANQKYSNRWLVLIAYLMGLSIGVHLLNLLAIPAIVFVYYFKKYKPTKKGIIAASAIAIIILGSIMYGIIPGIVRLASKFELLFVNNFGFGYHSGVIAYFILLAGLIVLALYYTHKKRKVVLNTIILCFTVILIGYSSFVMIVIRSSANPPMDENNPENIFSLLKYINREQYGDRPLLTGQYFNAPIIDQKKGEPTYIPKTTIKVEGNDTIVEKKYIISEYKPEYKYDPKFTTFLPRMWSNTSPSHIDAYIEWAGMDEKDLFEPKRDQEGNIKYNKQGQIVYDRNSSKAPPTFGQNIKFLIRYQIGWMYFRYFMWNFAGRQNDFQGHGNVLDGNWISGINFIDEARLGPQDDLPDKYKNNKARNKYYFLPLILGLIGLFYQAKKDSKYFWIVMLLFFFTGIAIVIYLNQYPYQPRERDYAYAGSFYAFAIWIGLGVLYIVDLLNKILSKPLSAGIATAACFFAVPFLMANQNWDDHDRSGRYTARDFAKNYLESCAPNAIIFTNGDNDTFPLWYAQEVEGVRTDIRVVNLSLLNTDWYIDQMKRKAYESDPVPFSLTQDQYVQGKRDYIPIIEQDIPGYISVDEIIQWIASDNPKTMVTVQGGERINYMPTKNVSIPVDSAFVINNGTVRKCDADKILKSVNFRIRKRYILKSELMILDLLATNDWKRPVYFAITVGKDSYLNLESFFQLEGLAYRLVPIKYDSPDGQIGRIATDIMYDNLMNKFQWGNIQDPSVYLDENNLRMTMNLRNNFARLANALLDENKIDSAVQVLDRCMEIMPKESVPYDVFTIGLAEAYYKAARLDKRKEKTNILNEKASEIIKEVAHQTESELLYYFRIPDKFVGASIDTEIQRGMAVMQELIRLTKLNKQDELSKELEEKFQNLYVIYVEKMQ
ncbi:MAG: DUF2723 domain-containing protein [Marinilabiliales bacterium]